MPVTFEPHKRLATLEDYVRRIDSYLPLNEIKIQLLRCRLVGYSLAAEINEPAYSRDYIDGIFHKRGMVFFGGPFITAFAKFISHDISYKGSFYVFTLYYMTLSIYKIPGLTA